MRRVIIGIVVCTGLLAPASASATVPSVFTGLASPAVTCSVQGAGPNAGQRWCSGSPSLVRSWDGTPVDVSVTLPPAPVGPDGNFPLIGIYHGWGQSKILPGEGSTQNWVDDGYAVFSMTDRGWHETCGSDASHANPPTWGTCADGDIKMIDMRYEVRDAQELMGRLVNEGVVNPGEIGAKGGSYGGMMAAALGTLKNRTMLPNGSLVPWVSPVNHTPISIAAATPSALATDLVYTQLPNGSTLDYAAQNPYFGPLGDKRAGVQKFTVFNGFFTGALLSPQGTPGADLLAFGSALNGPGPYDGLAPSLAGLAHTHGALNLDDSTPPAPMLLSDGFSDDFVGADESIKLYNRIRSDNPGTPVAMFFGDMGHARSNDKAADANQLRALQIAWMNHYVLGQGPVPPQNVQLRGITCPDSAPSSGPFTFPDWASLSPGEMRLTDLEPKTIAATGSLYGTAFTTPTGDACSSAPADDNPATANYRLPPTAQGFDVAGSPTLLMRLNVTGPSDQLVARLVDVAPDDTETLVDRGLLRPDMDAPDEVQVLQLHPNVIHVSAGHLLKLELMPDEYPYSHLNTIATDAEAQHPIEVLALQLRVPTLQKPGGSGGQILAPLPRYLPPGYTTAVGYKGKTTTKPPDLTKPAVNRPPVITRMCAGARATIVGTPRRDVIRGTRRRDVIVAFGGADKILGSAGNDIICAGAGNDSVYAGNGNDRVYGQTGNDVLRGSLRNDRLYGAQGRDRLFGQAGRDSLYGGPGRDVVRGGRGRDRQRQ